MRDLQDAQAEGAKSQYARGLAGEAPLLVVQRWRTAYRASAEAAMRPEPLLWILSDHLLDGLLVAGGVYQRVRIAVAGSLLRDLFKDFYHVTAAVRLPHDEDGDDRCAGHHREAIEAAGRRGELAEERHPDGLGALRVLIERDANYLAALERTQHLARR